MPPRVGLPGRAQIAAVPGVAVVARRARSLVRRLRGGARPVPPPIGPPPGAEPGDGGVNVLFLHHSTGESVWRGGVPQWFEAYNAARGTTYRIVEHAYPHAPYPWRNDPADYCRLWLPEGQPATSAVDGQETLADLTRHFDVIVLKTCFTGSDLLEDDPAGNAGSPSLDGDATSMRKTPANYRACLRALRDAFNAYPQTRFVVWTMPPRVAAETSSQAARLAAQVADWMRQDWDIPGDNVYLWDYRALAMEGAKGDVPGPLYAVSGKDSHPSAGFAARVAPLLAQRIVDVIEGRGDTGPRTGILTAG